MQQHLMEARIALESQILEAIDQLRKRKARPDADRICNFLLRKYSVDARDTIADLHRLIETEKVIQVDYKGHTSYRNASKWSRLQLYKNRPEGFVKEKLNSSMVSGAVAELVVEEPDYLDQGVPACRLIEQLLDGVSSPTSRRMVEDFLGKEVACGNLTRLSNGNYSLVATSDMTTTTSTPAAAPPPPPPPPPPPDAPRRDSTTTSSATTAATTTAAATATATAAAAAAAATTAAASHVLENGNTTRRVGKQASSGNNNGSSNSSSSNSSSSSSNGSNSNGSSNSGSNNNSNGSVGTVTTMTATTTTTIATMATATATTTTTMQTQSLIASAAVAAVTAAAAAAAAAELYEFDETDNLAATDSRSNTPRSSRQASPKVDQQQQQEQQLDIRIKKEECYEIILGKDDDVRRSVSPPSYEMECDGEPERDPLEITVPTTAATEEAKESPRCNNVVQTPNLKRSTKAERKQRLFARTEDPMDIKFEDDPRDSKEMMETLKEKREEADRRSSDDREDEEAGRSSTNTSPTPSNANAAGFRSARRKRAKKVFDPSDNNLVKRKRGRQPGSHNKTSLTQDSQDSIKVPVKDGPCRQCSLCAKEKQEALVACRDCTVRAHPSCIYSPEEMLQKANSNWQCERCKSCTVCCETSDAGPLVTCFNCDEAYHYCCHTPRITIPKSSSKWYCNDCLQKQYKANISQNASSISASRPDTPSNTPALPPVLSPQVSPARGSSDQMDLDDGPRDKIDPNIPDASDWTSEQVYQYFARLFPKEAEVFRQQDIDGHSLLLMKRSDVLTGLDLLLGPALKIYRHVLKLQVRRDDPKLYWL